MNKTVQSSFLKLFPHPIVEKNAQKDKRLKPAHTVMHFFWGVKRYFGKLYQNASMLFYHQFKPVWGENADDNKFPKLYTTYLCWPILKRALLCGNRWNIYLYDNNYFCCDGLDGCTRWQKRSSCPFFLTINIIIIILPPQRSICARMTPMQCCGWVRRRTPRSDECRTKWALSSPMVLKHQEANVHSLNHGELPWEGRLSDKKI